jgi:hypothetical protein
LWRGVDVNRNANGVRAGSVSPRQPNSGAHAVGVAVKHSFSMSESHLDLIPLRHVTAAQ